MPESTSSLVAFASSSIQYTWDSVTTILYTAGYLNLMIILTIITGIISVGLYFLRKLFI